MQPMASFDAQGRTIRRTRTPEEILADIPADVQEARRILREGGDPGPMPTDGLLFFGSPRHLEMVKNKPGFTGIAAPDYDIDRPEDLTVHAGSLLFGPMPQPLSKIMTKYGEVFVPQELALTAQTQWKTQPGIQVITGDHGPDCCCVCCCCCEKPKTIDIEDPRGRVCPPAKGVSLGFFFDGLARSLSDLTVDGKERTVNKVIPNTTMDRLYRRYGGLAKYYETHGLPGEADSNVSDAMEIIEKYFCARMGIDADGTVASCANVQIDIFGCSMGGTMALELADRLNDGIACPFPGRKLGGKQQVKVRFMGIIDPVANLLHHMHHRSVPPNVRYYFGGFASNKRRSGLAGIFDEVLEGVILAETRPDVGAGTEDLSPVRDSRVRHTGICWEFKDEIIDVYNKKAESATADLEPWYKFSIDPLKTRWRTAEQGGDDPVPPLRLEEEAK